MTEMDIIQPEAGEPAGREKGRAAASKHNDRFCIQNKYVQTGGTIGLEKKMKNLPCVKLQHF